MLSLTPRYDMFRFCLPKDFLPEEVTRKYQEIINKNPAVITTPIDYLNESIQAVHIPGLSGLTTEQTQHESNPITRQDKGRTGLGRINVDTSHNIIYVSPGNPLELTEKELNVTFRMNQGMYNWMMLYETIFNYICKHIHRPCTDVMYVDLMNEDGVVTCRIVLRDCFIESIDGLDFSFDKSTRDTGTFDISFKFNNIDFEFIP